MAKPTFLLAGAIFWVVAYMCEVWEIGFWIFKARPFQILVLPMVLVGVLLFVFGLLAKGNIPPVLK